MSSGRRISPLYSRRRRKEDDDDDAASRIIVPIEKTIQALAAPINIGPLPSLRRLPLFYPLSILLLNVLLDSSTTVLLFDISIVLFYTLIQQIRHPEKAAYSIAIDIVCR